MGPHRSSSIEAKPLPILQSLAGYALIARDIAERAALAAERVETQGGCNRLSSGSSPARYSHQYWAPVVANHFPPSSPFTQGQNLGYSLLPQGIPFSSPPRVPLLSHQPLARQRSGGAGGDYTLLPQTPKLERKRSKKGTREVSRLSDLEALSGRDSQCLFLDALGLMACNVVCESKTRNNVVWLLVAILLVDMM
ncbi:hypothetical protein KM043_014714 [Ampulex compressa]|nr:hypothetical protein KM043_014714 [Ampulex compressa]